jgi:RNA polymerase sigma factor (TIGR02999 family)
MSPDQSVTNLLQAWRGGDQEALQELLPLVYQELRALATRYFRDERKGHTLQPTALVHEAFMRLASSEVAWNDRAHFFAIAARMMRRILVDHAREKGAVKRGGGWMQTTLDDGVSIAGETPEEILELDRALDKFLALDERAAKAAELYYFGGLTYEETAEVLKTSPATVDRDLRVARTWLRRELTDE